MVQLLQHLRDILVRHIWRELPIRILYTIQDETLEELPPL
jgi:hypothetical protein